MPPAAPLRLDLRPSRLLVTALVLAHSLALAAAFVGLGGWPRYLVCALVLVSLARSLTAAALSGRHRSISLEFGEEGRASWKNQDGTWHEGRLGESHFVSLMFVVLELEDSRGHRKRMVIMPDSVPQEDFRRLRVWLRWGSRPTRQRSE